MVGFVRDGLPDRVGHFGRSIFEIFIPVSDERISSSLKLDILVTPVVDEVTGRTPFDQPVDDLSGGLRSQ